MWRSTERCLSSLHWTSIAGQFHAICIFWGLSRRWPLDERTRLCAVQSAHPHGSKLSPKDRQTAIAKVDKNFRGLIQNLAYCILNIFYTEYRLHICDFASHCSLHDARYRLFHANHSGLLSEVHQVYHLE